MVGVIFHPHR